MSELIKEFIDNDNVVLIADSPTAGQIIDWCDIARVIGKTVSFRNVEPPVGMLPSVRRHLTDLAKAGLLNIYHSPVQHTDHRVLTDMHRDVDSTFGFTGYDDGVGFARELRDLGVFLATNVIIDYKEFPNPDKDKLSVFNYVSWNPYWDGKWDRAKAEKRFEKYFGGGS
jgi:hypothetical protein